jgi:hypothetical protein
VKNHNHVLLRNSLFTAKFCRSFTFLMLYNNKLSNKRTRQSIKKRWKQAKGSEEVVFELSDAESDEFDES